MNEPEPLGRLHYKPAGRVPTPVCGKKQSENNFELMTTTDIEKVNCPSCRDHIRAVVEKWRRS